MQVNMVSVVIPTYKRKEKLAMAVKSCLKQTYKNMEVIVVDDNVKGSKEREDTIEIMKEFKEDNRVIYIMNEKNLGGSLTRNRGIEEAKGEYIAFLDDDDEFEVNKIEEQMNLVKQKQEKKLGIIYCYANAIDENGKEINQYKSNEEGLPLFEQMKGCIAATSQWLVSKEALVNVGMFEDTPNKQDSILFLKLLANGYATYRVDKVLLNYFEGISAVKISGLKEKNIIGINNYREWCRKYFYKITSKERKIVEYKFSKELLTYYIYFNHMNTKKELINMIKIAPCKKETIIAIGKYLFKRRYKERLNNENKKFNK